MLYGLRGRPRQTAGGAREARPAPGHGRHDEPEASGSASAVPAAAAVSPAAAHRHHAAAAQDRAAASAPASASGRVALVLLGGELVAHSVTEQTRVSSQDKRQLQDQATQDVRARRI